MNTQYNEIIENYPNTITLDQFYRICHISKWKAKWLLENGIAPCQDSGKKTRRFKIQTRDVVSSVSVGALSVPLTSVGSELFSILGCYVAVISIWGVLSQPTSNTKINNSKKE